MQDSDNEYSRRLFLRDGSLFLLTAATALTARSVVANGPEDKPALTAALVTDAHYADADVRGTRFYRESLIKMRETVKILGEKRPTLAIEVGDLVDSAPGAGVAGEIGFLKTINAEFMGSRYNVNGTGNGIASFNYWTPENPTNDFPRPRWGVANVSSYGGYTGYNSLNFIDGSFIKLKTVTLAYTLPASITRKVFSEKIRLYATGNNIWTKAKSHFLKDYDPERGGFETTPLTRQFVFGANVDF